MQYEHSKNYLVHHGVKGQRWGVRRYQKYNGELTSLGQKLNNAEQSGNPEDIRNAKSNYKQGIRDAKFNKLSIDMHKDAAEARTTKNPKELSTGELKKNIDRLRTEEQYSKQVSPIKTKLKNFFTNPQVVDTVKRVLLDAGYAAGKAIVTGAAIYGINKLLAKRGLKLPDAGLLKI